MPAVVILRIKDPGPHSADLLKQIERELGVMAIPQTAGYVPVAMDDLDPPAAYDAVKSVLDRSDPQWPEHLQLRSCPGVSTSFQSVRGWGVLVALVTALVVPAAPFASSAVSRRTAHGIPH